MDDFVGVCGVGSSDGRSRGGSWGTFEDDDLVRLGAGVLVGWFLSSSMGTSCSSSSAAASGSLPFPASPWFSWGVSVDSVLGVLAILM